MTFLKPHRRYSRHRHRLLHHLPYSARYQGHESDANGSRSAAPPHLRIVAQWFHLNALTLMISTLEAVWVLGFIIVFQPELRRGLANWAVQVLPLFHTNS